MIEGYRPGPVRVDPVGVAPAEVVALALRCELLEATMRRIALGIAGRMADPDWRPEEFEHDLPGQPKPDWKLAQETLDALDACFGCGRGDREGRNVSRPTSGCTYRGRKDAPPLRFPCFRKAWVVLRETKGNPFVDRLVCRTHADEMVASGYYREVADCYVEVVLDGEVLEEA